MYRPPFHPQIRKDILFSEFWHGLLDDHKFLSVLVFPQSCLLLRLLLYCSLDIFSENYSP